MPRMDEKRAIREVRINESTRHLPVVVMSTSSANLDVLECLELGANAFVVKPPSVGALAQRIRALEDFWLQAAAPVLR
jgi:two-component system response regulator